MRSRLGRAGIAGGAGGRLLVGAAVATLLLPSGLPALAQDPPAAQAPGGSAQDLKAAIAEIKRRVEQQRQAASSAAPGATAAADDLKSARDRIEGLARTMTELRAERDGLRGQLLQARDDLTRAQQKAAALDTERQGVAADAAGKLDAMQKELAAARAHADELAKAGQQAQAAGDRARQEAADRAARLASLQAEADRLRQTLAGGEEARRTLAAEADRLRARNAELEAGLAKAEADAAAGQAAAERRLTSEVEVLKGQLVAAQKDNADLRAVGASSVEEVRSLSEQLIASLADKDRLVAASVELSSSKAFQDLQLAAHDNPPPPLTPTATATAAAAVTAAKGEPAVQLVSKLDAASDDDTGWNKTVLEGSLFTVGSERLAPDAVEPLSRIARQIRDARGPVRIVGHTDGNGDSDQNQRLSLKRAQAVRDYLVATYSLDRSRFKVDGMGSASPIASNDTANGRRANRRVEVFVAER